MRSYWAANAALLIYPFMLYPCCGRLTAALRGPNIIKLLCSFALTRGFAGGVRPSLRVANTLAFAGARGESVDICWRVG